MTEPRDIKIRRLKMRSMRRGTKEMDLILQSFAERHLAQMDAAGLAHYDTLLEENDLDLYRWISGQDAAPDRFSALIAKIAAISTGIIGKNS